jgi:ribosomal protein S18 acetylase RimI-like enzyme
MSIVVRTARLEDVPAIVAIHQRAFPGFLLTVLGPRFLTLMYRGHLTVSGGSLDVAVEHDARIVGFLAAASAPSRFFNGLRRRHGLAMGLAMIPGLLRHPWWCAGRLANALFYRGDRPPALHDHWLISSLAVAPAVGGRGAGRALVEACCQQALHAGAYGVYLQTDQEANGATLGFYAKLGFSTHAEQVRVDGRRLLMMKRSFAR